MDSTNRPDKPSEGANAGESAGRIIDLLAEGEVAFEHGEYQAAIDAWSRIFLIDLDHQEATRRIETARRLQAEQARQVEEIYHDALSRLESGDRELARSGFERVLTTQPGHFAAREQLRRLDAEPAGETSPPPEPALPYTGASPQEAPSDRSGDAAAATAEPTVYEPTAPTDSPRPSPPRPRPAPPGGFPAAAVERRRAGSRAFLWIGGVVLLVAAAGGALLYSQRERLFPNAPSIDEPTAGTAATPLASAQRLHDAGRTTQAIAMLERVPPESPDYAQARTLLAQWENGEEAEVGPSDKELEQQEDLLNRAQDAEQRGDLLVAHSLLDEAAAIAPLAGDAATLETEVNQRLEPVAGVLQMYRDGAWEHALPRLWQVREENPGDPIAERLLVDGYYNLAIRDLQRNAPDAALDMISEARQLDPEDPSLERVAEFARAYQGGPLDLRYRLFVKYLPFR